MEKLIAQGAEAQILLNENTIIKRRIKKSYRLPELDQKIRKQRTKKEYNLLQKASKLIPVPKVLKINNKGGGNLRGTLVPQEIDMEFINGKKLSEHLDKLNYKEISNQIGKQIAILHDNNIIHGDLTTSNMILENKTNKLYFIDFGLGFTSSKAEDKAVDLHLIKEALEAKHFNISHECFKAIIEGYKTSKNADKVIQRLKKVESRGRYKERD